MKVLGVNKCYSGDVNQSNISVWQGSELLNLAKNAETKYQPDRNRFEYPVRWLTKVNDSVPFQATIYVISVHL